MLSVVSGTSITGERYGNYGRATLASYIVRINRAYWNSKVAAGLLTSKQAAGKQLHKPAEECSITGMLARSYGGVSLVPDREREGSWRTCAFVWDAFFYLTICKAPRLRAKFSSHVFSCRGHSKATAHEGYRMLARMKRTQPDIVAEIADGLRRNRHVALVNVNLTGPAESETAWHRLGEWGLATAAHVMHLASDGLAV